MRKSDLVTSVIIDDLVPLPLSRKTPLFRSVSMTISVGLEIIRAVVLITSGVNVPSKSPDQTDGPSLQS